MKRTLNIFLKICGILFFIQLVLIIVVLSVFQLKKNTVNLNEITWKHKGANYDIILDSKNDILIEGYNLFLTGKYPYLYGIFTKNKKCYAFLINLETKETLIENNENQIKISEKLFYLKKKGIQFQELNNFMDINGGEYSDKNKIIKLSDLFLKKIKY